MAIQEPTTPDVLVMPESDCIINLHIPSRGDASIYLKGYRV